MDSNKMIYRVSLAILVIIYSVGIAGFLAGYESLMRDLTPYTLLLSWFLLIINHRRWNRFFVIFMITIMFAGFIIEVVGVETGWVFGNYAYGNTLGYKLFEVPLLIGVNWFVLIYSSGMITNLIKTHWFLKVLIGASLMVLIDLSLEPVAVAYDFWTWEEHIIPLQNYIAWFITAMVFHMIFQTFDFRRINRFAIYLFIVQWVFFMVLSFKIQIG